MTVRRVVTDLPSRGLPESATFYRRVLRMEPVMDQGWIVTLADPWNRARRSA